MDENLLVRRINIVAGQVIREKDIPREGMEQLDLFSDPAEQQRRQAQEDAAFLRERRRQQAMLQIKRKYGKNAIFKGMNLEEGATAMERNRQIGGHKA